MLIRTIKIFGHPGIGDLQLSFVADDGRPYELVILAGESGTGKSVVLEVIFAALSGAMGVNIGTVELEIELDAAEVQKVARMTSTLPPPGVVKFWYDSAVQNEWNKAFRLLWGAEPNQHTGFLPSHPSGAPTLRCFYNEASVDYQFTKTDSITGLSLDTTAQSSTRSAGTAQHIAQLLIDIRNADAEEVAVWAENNRGAAVPDAIIAGRMQRFRDAFRLMMPTKSFHQVARSNGRVVAEFQEYGRISPIDSLSTGEKQVIFRGGYLLRDRDKLAGSIVLIDEPELSLHPDWQERVVAYYRAITQQPDSSHPQIFMATHSPFIVHGAAGAQVIILEKDPVSGVIAEAASPSYPVASGRIAVKAFSLERFIAASAHRTLIMTEGSTDAELLKAAWSKLRGGDLPFEIRSALGAKNISTTLNDPELAAKLGGQTLLGLYDFDHEGFNQWKGAWKKESYTGTEAVGLKKKHPSLAAATLLLPVPPHRASLASHALGHRSMMPIELLFEDRDLPENMVGHTLVAGGMSIPNIKDARKTDFAAHASTLPASSFHGFEPLIKAIEAVIR